MPKDIDKAEDARRRLEKEIRAVQDALNSMLPIFSTLKVDVPNVVFWEAYWEMNGTYREAARQNAIVDNISFFTPKHDKRAIVEAISRFFELREKLVELQSELEKIEGPLPAKRQSIPKL